MNKRFLLFYSTFVPLDTTQVAMRSEIIAESTFSASLRTVEPMVVPLHSESRCVAIPRVFIRTRCVLESK